MQKFSDCSKSTNVPSGQTSRWISSRVTSSPERLTRRVRTRAGCGWRRVRTPGFPQLAASRVELEDAEAEPSAPLSLHPQQVWLSSHGRLLPFAYWSRPGMHLVCRGMVTHRILIRGCKRLQHKAACALMSPSCDVASSVRRSNRVERASGSRSESAACDNRGHVDHGPFPPSARLHLRPRRHARRQHAPPRGGLPALHRPARPAAVRPRRCAPGWTASATATSSRSSSASALSPEVLRRYADEKESALPRAVARTAGRPARPHAPARRAGDDGACPPRSPPPRRSRTSPTRSASSG